MYVIGGQEGRKVCTVAISMIRLDYYIIIFISIKTWKRLMAIELNMDHKPSLAMTDL